MTKEQKDKAAKIWGDVKVSLEKGYNASKKGLKKAGVAIQKFSDISVVAVEKKQFEAKRKRAYASLGELVAQKLSAKSAKSITSSDAEISELLKLVAQLNKEIAKREKVLKDFEGKNKNAKSKGSAKPAAKSASKVAKKPAKKPAAKK